MDRKSPTHSHRQQSFKCDKKKNCAHTSWLHVDLSNDEIAMLYIIWTTKILRSLRRLIWEIIAVKWVSWTCCFARRDFAYICFHNFLGNKWEHLSCDEGDKWLLTNSCKRISSLDCEVAKFSWSGGTVVTVNEVKYSLNASLFSLDQ